MDSVEATATVAEPFDLLPISGNAAANGDSNVSSNAAPGGGYGARYANHFAEMEALPPGLQVNDFPADFLSGLTLQESEWAAKLGGMVKADFIHDFDAIDSTDFFMPATIPVGAADRTHSRMHARQSRLTLDTRWYRDRDHPLRIVVEGDFYGAANAFRLRHAYGEYQDWILGQTWSTFAHRAALPNTLDNVGDVASISRRQAQIRWMRPVLDDRLTLALAVEDSVVFADETLSDYGVARTPMPDLVARLRWTESVGQVQIAVVGRQVGFQPTGLSTRTKSVGGLSLTSYLDLPGRSRLYGGLLWGEGIGSYRDLPDIALVSATQGTALKTVAWYLGVTHQWTERWSSNLTFSNGATDNTPFQAADSLHEVQYLAANLIWHPTPWTFAGMEYLWGQRENRDQQRADANRMMVSVGFLLP